MATVTAKITESLLGTEVSPDLSLESKTRFLRHAKEDDNGQWFMTEEDFINAVAPAEEDYVSLVYKVGLIVRATDIEANSTR
jgi:solute carrier family 25 aspartate/glutamate transporter 12/13